MVESGRYERLGYSKGRQSGIRTEISEGWASASPLGSLGLSAATAQRVKGIDFMSNIQLSNAIRLIVSDEGVFRQEGV